MAEEVGFKTVLYCEELGVDVLVTLPDVVSVAEARHDVERGEHGGSEVVVLLRVRPVVGAGEHGEDDGEGVVTELFEGGKQSLDALLGGRGDVLVGDDAEAVGRGAWHRRRAPCGSGEARAWNQSMSLCERGCPWR